MGNFDGLAYGLLRGRVGVRVGKILIPQPRSHEIRFSRAGSVQARSVLRVRADPAPPMPCT
jgi:hypothetical protein